LILPRAHDFARDPTRNRIYRRALPDLNLTKLGLQAGFVRTTLKTSIFVKFCTAASGACPLKSLINTPKPPPTYKTRIKGLSGFSVFCKRTG
jgi:hypothetical protein